MDQRLGSTCPGNGSPGEFGNREFPAADFIGQRGGVIPPHGVVAEYMARLRYFRDAHETLSVKMVQLL